MENQNPINQAEPGGKPQGTAYRIIGNTILISFVLAVILLIALSPETLSRFSFRADLLFFAIVGAWLISSILGAVLLLVKKSRGKLWLVDKGAGIILLASFLVLIMANALKLQPLMFLSAASFFIFPLSSAAAGILILSKVQKKKLPPTGGEKKFSLAKIFMAIMRMLGAAGIILIGWAVIISGVALFPASPISTALFIAVPLIALGAVLFFQAKK